MENIRTIGFKRKDEKVVENTPAVVEGASKVTENAPNVAEEVNEVAKRPTLLVSPAQADLIETIENLADIISSREFSKYEDDARINFVNTLYNAIALNTELTTKTMLLLAR
ncbi:MAG: hypothetical protein WC389_22090 [Lutibacter sp.]|jgi:hypothetical protein